MNINLTKQNGITLETASKLCEEDINIIPTLQEKTIEASGEYTPDDGYVGISKVTVNVTTPTYPIYAGETEAVPTGFNVTYKADWNYFNYIPSQLKINLTFADGTTASYNITAQSDGTFPTDWQEQTGKEPASGETGNGYTWRNVVSITIGAYAPFAPDSGPYIMVNETNVGSNYTADLTEDIIIYSGGGDF